MFCNVCGNELKVETKFCPNCGQPTDDSNQNSESDKWFYINNSIIKDVVPSVSDNVVSSKYAWTLATVPILISWFAELIDFNALIVLICTVSPHGKRERFKPKPFLCEKKERPPKDREDVCHIQFCF